MQVTIWLYLSHLYKNSLWYNITSYCKSVLGESGTLPFSPSNRIDTHRIQGIIEVMVMFYCGAADTAVSDQLNYGHK